SFKWFILLVFLLPDRVAAIVPGGEKSAYWGAVFGIGATWAIIGPALFGSISDRLGDRRPFILLGSALTCLSMLALYWANGLLLLGGAYLLVQVADDLSTGPYSAVLPEAVERDQRGLASGLMSGAMSLSQVAAVLVMLLLPLSTAGLLVLIGALNLSTAVIVVRLIRKSQARRSPQQSFLQEWAGPWKDQDFRAVWATRFLVTLGFYFIMPYANFYVRDMIADRRLLGYDLGSPDRATAVLAFLIALAGAAGSFAAGSASDRLGRKPVTVGSVSVMAISLGIAAALLPGMNALSVIAIPFGLGYGAFQTANWAMVSDVLPDPEGLGRDMGIWQTSISSVQLVAGAAGVAITFGNRLAPGGGYRLLFLLAAVVVAASGFAVRLIRSSR
ncbi:MAG TPA: MFS transporter, partial [Fimbriimonas sp.]|nr:MFS transporter [Fimbriimonas sp.]